MTDIPTYKGVPFGDLRIESIFWSQERAQHLLRSLRHPGEMDLAPEWATEAALDPQRVIRIAGAENPETASLKIIGFSPSVPGGAMLKVWIWSDDPAVSGEWIGGSASIANESDKKRYERSKS